MPEAMTHHADIGSLEAITSSAPWSPDATFERDVEALAPMRILVVEDDDEMRRLITRALLKDGYLAIGARDVAEALDWLGDPVLDTRPRFDLLITDVRLPGASGIDLIERIRAADWALNIIVVTAFGSAALHQGARRLGAAAVLDKPFDIDELRWVVGQLLPTVT
jgi:DNA-binding response OmpR family regulator